MVRAAVRGVQARVGAAVRSRVAGPDASRRAQRIWGSEGDRWFTEADPIWLVHRDASMFSGGLTALLLQSVHPRAMAGVAGHSTYKGDPWGRLQRTSDYIATTTFGTIEDATATINRVRAIHRRIKGADHMGRPYAASDPDLLRWVHVAEIWSFLEAYQAFARTPLTPAEADTYVRQTTLTGGMLGCAPLPTTRAELDACLEGYRGELEITPAAHEAARFVLAEPPLPHPMKPGYWMLALGGVALLPTWARDLLELPLKQPLVPAAKAAGKVGVAGVRWGLAVAPPETVPQRVTTPGLTVEQCPAGHSPGTAGASAPAVEEAGLHGASHPN